jgi:hypothetical protein
MTRPEDGQGGGEASPEGEERAEGDDSAAEDSAGVAGGEPAAAAGEEVPGPSDNELIRALADAIRRVTGGEKSQTGGDG